MELIFLHLAIILLTAFIVSYIVRSFNQPLIVGYIIAGVIISPFIIGFGASKEIIDIFSQFGIAFLLFMVGLHLNPKVIKEVGVASLFIGIIQVVLTFAFGFFVSSLLGFDLVTSAYLGIALAFSSTIIIMKLLSDKKQIDSLYGKISIGILIVQDLVAIGVLMFISSSSQGLTFNSILIKGLLGGGGLIVLLFLFGFFILPFLTRNIAKSQELLFLFSITWAFVIAALFSYFGFSIEIGALIAGVLLSTTPYSTEISSKIKPLRDFFLIIFFIILGLNIELSSISSVITTAIIFSLIALIFKPFILMSLMAIFGYTKRNNFLVGTTLAQISEFSLIILALGVSVGHINPGILSTFTLSGIISITLSTYMIMYSNEIYKKVSHLLSVFERKEVKKERRIRKKYDTILFGYNRIGFGILKSFKKIRKNYLVVDFNPDVISDLNKSKIPCLYGDAYDAEFLEELSLDKVQLVVSTIPDFETNVLLIETIRIINPNAIVILRSDLIEDAFALYKKGANYVLTPHFLGGEYVAKMIVNLKTKEEDYEKEKLKHVRILKEMTEKNKEHPRAEKG